MVCFTITCLDSLDRSMESRPIQTIKMSDVSPQLNTKPIHHRSSLPLLAEDQQVTHRSRSSHPSLRYSAGGTLDSLDASSVVLRYRTDRAQRCIVATLSDKLHQRHCRSRIYVLASIQPSPPTGCY